MAVTLVSSQQVDANVWRLEWSSDLESPTFYLYASGTLIAITTATVHYAVVQPGTYLLFEVFDDESETPAEQWPDGAVLSWASLPNVAHYRIDQYVDEEWVEVGRVYPNPRGDCRYQSAPLADSTEHRFRCVAVAPNGRESAAREWTILMVRRPDVPALSYTYDDETTTVTINA